MLTLKTPHIDSLWDSKAMNSVTISRIEAFITILGYGWGGVLAVYFILEKFPGVDFVLIGRLCLVVF